MMVILWLKFTTNVDNLMSRIAVETMAVSYEYQLVGYGTGRIPGI